MVDDVQYSRLYKLGFHNRRNNFKQRFLWKYNGSFRNRIDISAEMESAQVLQEVLAEYTQASQIIYVFIGEIQIFNIIDDLLKSRADRISVVAGILAKENVKNNLFILSFCIITLHHGQFIQVCQQS